MSTAALICDTGALLDCLVATAPDHRAFREVIDSLANPLRPGAGTGGGRLLSSKGTGGNDRFDSRLLAGSLYLCCPHPGTIGPRHGHRSPVRRPAALLSIGP